MKRKIVLSCSFLGTETEMAKKLYNDLKKTGLVEPWMKLEDLLVGQIELNEVNRAIDECSYFLPLFSSASISMVGDFQREWKRGLKIYEEQPSGNIFLIPVRLDDCQLPQDLKSIHSVDLFKSYENGLENLFRAIGVKNYQSENEKHYEKEDIFLASEMFVDRETEKELIDARLSGKQVDKKILEFVGIPGQGKTELLKWAYTRAKEYRNYSTYIDLGKKEFQRPEIFPILESIVKQIAIDDKYFLEFERLLLSLKEEFNNYQKEYFTSPSKADRTKVNKLENDVFMAFMNGFENLLNKMRVFLCLDAADKAYEPAIRQLEEKLLVHFVIKPTFIFFVAGQIKFRWREIGRYIIQQPLGAFTKEATKELILRLTKKEFLNINLNDIKEITDEIWDITRGNPFAIHLCINCRNSIALRGIKQKEANGYYSECIKLLINKFIIDRVLEDFDIDPSYPKPIEILLSIAPIRRIEFGTFWFAMNERLGNYFHGKPMGYFAQLLSELQNNIPIFIPYLLGGIDMDEVPRHILISHFRLNMPDEYIQFQESMKRHYEELIANTRDASQIKNIVEKIYHQIIILKEKDKFGDIEQKITQELEKYLDFYFTKEFIRSEGDIYDQLVRLQNALEKDEDIKNYINLAPLISLIKIRINNFVYRKGKSNVE